MNTLSSHTHSDTALINEAGLLKRYSRWFLALGILMVVLGTATISWACIATMTVAATWLFGFFLLASGIGEILNSFWTGRWSGMLIHMLIGVLYTMVGFIIISQPEDAAIQLTLLIALFLMVGGIFRIVFSISEQFAGWGWVLLNGAVTFMLGMLIFKGWPLSGQWVIGLFIGIELIMNGFAWIMLSLGLRKIDAHLPSHQHSDPAS